MHTFFDFVYCVYCLYVCTVTKYFSRHTHTAFMITVHIDLWPPPQSWARTSNVTWFRLRELEWRTVFMNWNVLVTKCSNRQVFSRTQSLVHYLLILNSWSNTILFCMCNTCNTQSQIILSVYKCYFWYINDKLDRFVIRISWKSEFTIDFIWTHFPLTLSALDQTKNTTPSHVSSNYIQKNLLSDKEKCSLYMFITLECWCFQNQPLSQSYDLSQSSSEHFFESDSVNVWEFFWVFFPVDVIGLTHWHFS